jgi:hypothetical protein
MGIVSVDQVNVDSNGGFSTTVGTASNLMNTLERILTHPTLENRLSLQ